MRMEFNRRDSSQLVIRDELKPNELVKLNDEISLWKFNKSKKKYEIIDLYPIYDYNLKIDDMVSMDLEVSIEQGLLQISVPFDKYGQEGTHLGTTLMNADIQNDFYYFGIDNDFYNLRGFEIPDGKENGGIMHLVLYDFTITLKKVPSYPNKLQTKKEEKKVGYVGMNIVNKGSCKNFLRELFKKSFYDKKIIQVGNPKNKEKNDTSNLPWGFTKDIKLDFDDFNITIEMEIQSIQDLLDHINSKYSKYLKVYITMVDGLMQLIIHKGRDIDKEKFVSYNEQTTGSNYNENFMNIYHGITPDAKYSKTFNKDRKFTPVVAEEYRNYESFRGGNEDSKSDFESAASGVKRTPSINSFAFKDVEIIDFLDIRIGDKLFERHVVGKKLTLSNSEYVLSIVFQEEYEAGDVTIIEQPDYAYDTELISTWLYYDLDSIADGLVRGQKIKPNTKIGKSDTFFIQSQTQTTNVKLYERDPNNTRDSIGGTNDPNDDMKTVGNPNNHTISLDNDYMESRPNTNFKWSEEYPNLGCFMVADELNTEVLVPNQANAWVVDFGSSLEFGSYVIIKFKN